MDAHLEANDNAEGTHARGFPAWGPPTLCGEGQPSEDVPAVITCPRCLDILESASALAARAAEVERTHGAPPPVEMVDVETWRPRR